MITVISVKNVSEGKSLVELAYGTGDSLPTDVMNGSLAISTADGTMKVFDETNTTWNTIGG